MATGSLDKKWGLAREVERHDSSETWSYTHRNDRYMVNQSFIENFSDYNSAREAIKKRKLGSSARCLFVTFGSNQSKLTDNDDISLLWFTPMTKETPNPEIHHQLVGILVNDISSDTDPIPTGKYIWADVKAFDHVDVWSPGSDAATRMRMHDIYGRPPPLTTAQQLHHYHFNEHGDTWADRVFQLTEFFIKHDLFEQTNGLWKHLDVSDLSRLLHEMGVEGLINVRKVDLKEQLYRLVKTTMNGKSPPLVAEDRFGPISTQQGRAMLQHFDLASNVESMKAKADRMDTFLTRRGFWRNEEGNRYLREDVMQMTYMKKLLHRLGVGNHERGEYSFIQSMNKDDLVDLFFRRLTTASPWITPPITHDM